MEPALNGAEAPDQVRGGQRGSSGAPRITGLMEAALYVDDLDAAAGFYGDLLGLEEIARIPGRHIFFRCGGAVLLAFIAEATGKPYAEAALPIPPHGAEGPGHVCFALQGGAFDGLLARLAEHGIAVESDFHWPNGARSVYIRDPAGNSVEFAEPKLWERV